MAVAGVALAAVVVVASLVVVDIVAVLPTGAGDVVSRLTECVVWGCFSKSRLRCPISGLLSSFSLVGLELWELCCTIISGQRISKKKKK